MVTLQTSVCAEPCCLVAGLPDWSRMFYLTGWTESDRCVDPGLFVRCFNSDSKKNVVTQPEIGPAKLLQPRLQNEGVMYYTCAWCRGTKQIVCLMCGMVLLFLHGGTLFLVFPLQASTLRT